MSTLFKARNNPYKDSQAKTASKEQLLVMLYDTLVNNMQRIVDILDKKRGDGSIPLPLITEKVSLVNYNMEIINTLNFSLDMKLGGEISQNLRTLYLGAQSNLLDAHIRDDVEPFRRYLKIFSDLRDAWRQALVNISTNPHSP